MKQLKWKFNKNRIADICKRLLVLLLCAAMLAPSIPVLEVHAGETPNYSNLTPIALGSYVNYDLYIYNYMAYSSAANEINIIANSRYSFEGEQSSPDRKIIIGDNQIEGNDNTKPQDSDINTCLNGLNLAGAIVVSPVFAGMTGGPYTVHMGVINSPSTVNQVTLNANATLTLDVQANVTINTLTLNPGSTVTINVASGVTATINNITGSGNLVVNSGSGTLVMGTASLGTLNATDANVQVANSLYVSGDLNLSGTTLSGQDTNATVTAGGNISVSGGLIKKLGLFGYGNDGLTGAKSMTFGGGTHISDITNLGVSKDSKYKVTLNGIETLQSISGTSFTADFNITYSHNDVQLSYSDVVGYRAKFTGKDKELSSIVGTINADGALSAGSTVLPEYEQAGYTFSGWHINGGESIYKNLVENDVIVISVAGDLTLTTSVIAGNVSVIFDHGFVPDAYSHVCEKTATSDDKREWYLVGENITVGATIDVSEHPTRFGYKFTGWKITTGSGTTTISSEQKTYTIAYSDLTEKNGVNELRIEACWEKDTYPFRLSLAASESTVPLENIRISFNGMDWYSMDPDADDYIDTHPGYDKKFTWHADDKYFAFDHEITYGDTLADYLKSVNSENITMLPILQDNRDAATAKSFSAWVTQNGKAITEDMSFEYSLYGMLDSRGENETLESFAQQLHSNPTTLQAAWGDLQFDLSVTKQDGWDVLVDGTLMEKPTGDTYALKVKSGSTITLRTSVSNANSVSLWKVMANGTKIYLTEQAHKAGDQYINYTFTMPKKTVTAVYNSDVSGFYFDISKSPITFAENITYNGMSRNGFWYNYTSDDIPFTPLFAKVGAEYVAMSELTGTETVSDYFYAWNNSNFYVTSNSVATQNQLTIANKITVYLKNCNLIARDEYTANVTVWNTKTADNVFLDEVMTPYANIILSTDYHTAYVTDLKIDGKSTINCISMSKYEISSEHKTQLNIIGINSRDELVMDSILITHQPKLENLYITVPSETNYLTWFIYGRATIADYNDTIIINCKIYMPDKNIDLNLGEIKFQLGTVADFHTIKYYGDFALSGVDTFVHIYGDVIGNYNTISLSDNASLVVEGSVKRSWVHATAKGVINTDGYLVVKGNLLEFSRLEVKKGTIVANVISVGSKFEIQGGTVVANMITNKPYSGGSGNEKNEYDTFPFTTYSQHDTSEQSWSIFGDAKVYLFGYYKLNSSKNFDTTVKTTDFENPISELITDMADGKLDSDLSAIIENHAVDHNGETFALGNSSYTKGINTEGRIRSVKIYGDAELYAAGNVTFYNETSIYDNAKITVYGTLGSRRDMTIYGTPTIYAECIAGGGDLTYRDSNGNSRWAEIILQGGTIYVDSLGADNDKRNTLIVEGEPTLAPWKSNAAVAVVQDVCINYIYGSDFTVANDQKLDNARFFGEWANGFPTTMTGAKIFSTVTATADSSTSRWHYGSLDGVEVQGISDNGMLAEKEAFITSRETGNAYEYIDLYAVKDRYTLTVKKLDSGKGASANGTALNQGDEMSLLAGQVYTLTLDDADDINKTVLWYQDPNGNLHNVPLTKEEVPGTLTFKMPASNVELYITETLPLDLSSYSLAFFDDGFMAELTQSRNDSYFEYNGSYFITQTEKTETVNLISVRENLAAGQTLTINSLNQKIREQYGIEFCDNVTAELIVDGDNTVSFIHIPETANVTIKGKTGNNADTLRVHIYTDKNESVGAERSAIGSVNGKAGTITIKDLHLVKKDKSARMFSSYSSTDLTSKLLTLENVLFDDRETGNSDEGFSYNTGSFAVNFQDVIISQSNLFFKGDKSYQPVIFNSCKNVTIASSIVTQNDFGSSSSNGAILFSTITGEVKIIGNSVVTITRENTAAKVFHEYLYKKDSYPAAVYVMDKAQLIVEGRLALFGDPKNDNKKGLVVSGSATVEVTNAGTSDSYLLCNELTVSDSAKVKADYVIISAFTWPSVSTVNGTAHKGERPLFETWASQASTADRIETGVLTQTGGTINASKFIGGAYGAGLNISGGVLNSSAIGTIDAIFGYATLIPQEDQEQVYRYTINAFNCESTVNITGGTVNISENGYLGGHNSTVSISGGEVKLGANATVGMTDDQLTDAQNDATANGKKPADEIKVSVMITGGKVEGDDAQILAPYGSVNISGTNTAVKAKRLIADYGTVEICEAHGTYEPITTFSNINKAGVFVSEYLSAQSIHIENSAVVYAHEIKSIIPDASTSGGLFLENAAILYANSYGVSGANATEDSISVIKNSAIYCSVRVVPITYYLNDDSYDVATNSNPSSYKESVGQYLKLDDPTRHGYDFGGWYLDEEMTEANKVPETGLHRGNTNPVVLYAKWIPKKVTFKITIDGDRNGIDLRSVKSDLEDGVLDEANNTFTFKKTFEVAYRTQIQGGTGINLSEIKLPMWQTLALDYLDANGNSVTVVATGNIATIVDKYIFDEAEKKGGVFELRISAVQKTRHLVYFHLNSINNFKPEDAVFESGKTDHTTTTTVSSWVDFGSTIGSGNGFVNNDTFIEASAPGYKSEDWVWVTGDGTKVDNLEKTVLANGVATDYYADWQPKQYVVKFDATVPGAADNIKSNITVSDEPTGDEPDKVTGTVLYDQEINRNLEFNSAVLDTKNLPKAWTEGYVFKHWAVTVGNKTVEVKDTSKLNLSTFESLLEAKGDTDAVALEIKAVYSKVKVTYVTNEGTWKSADFGGTVGEKTNAIHETTYGELLAGLVKESDGTIKIYSTAAEGFSGTYDANDYRHVIMRKGYTFGGWYEKDAETPTTTTPKYEDITVTAKWTPNEYTLVLNPKMEGDNAPVYNGLEFYGCMGYSPEVTVVVSEVLEGDGTSGSHVNVKDWPDRALESANWYVRNAGSTDDNAKRFLLGFTFGALNPGVTGSTDYTAYGQEVTKLVNQKTMLVKGQSTFFIPDSYHAGHLEDVYDYPSGSKIQMYAVYRERALVFYEYYIDPDTSKVVQTEMAAYPHYTWSDYPITYASSDAKKTVEGLGYTLLGWYFHDAKATSTKYPETAADYKYENYINNSGNSYDINVYTVYVAQVTVTDKSLSNGGKSYGDKCESYLEYTIPNSMQEGEMYYSFGTGVEDAVGSGRLKLVSVDKMNGNYYTESWGTGNTPENTVAIKATITSQDGKYSEPLELSADGGTFEQHVTAGWTIRFELYTSNIVSSDNDYTFDLTFGFKGDNLKDQKIKFEDMKVYLTPSLYKVVYNSNLPNDDLNLLEPNGFSTAEPTITDEKVAYGSALKAAPVLEGYNNIDGWYLSTNSSERYTSLTMPLSDENHGVVNVTTDWEIQSYLLDVDSVLLNYWDVKYTPIGEESKTYTVAEHIPYHSTVTFTSKNGVDAYYKHPEFVALTMMTPGTKTVVDTTDLWAYGNGQSFKMQAEDVYATFSDVRTLYLQPGDIVINKESYVQNETTVTWHGDYIIQMNENGDVGEGTDHTLTLNGNLVEKGNPERNNERNIILGNLKMNSDNSIVLGTGAVVALDLESANTVVTAKNILVPLEASLTVNGSGGEIQAAPSVTNAGIGDDNGNGKITLNNLNVDLRLLAGSSASGIGGASQAAASGEEIVLDNCTVEVSQSETALGAYKGAWIGGENVSQVSFNGSSLVQKADSAKPGLSYAFDGAQVVISNSTVMANATVYARNTLNIKGSTITQDISTQVTRPPVGTASGTTTVTNSAITVTVTGGTWENMDSGVLYSGTLKIADAASDVTINGAQLIEVGNGDIEIHETDYKQGNQTHDHNGKYVLLGETDVATSTLVTNKDNAVIALDAQAKSATLASISFDGDLTFEGASGKILTVKGDFSGTGNLTLEDITVDATGHNVGSLGSNVELAENESNKFSNTATEATTVTVKGTSTITAAEFGALGAHNNTFTFVELSENATISGKIVKDYYRIYYNTEKNVSALSTVFRTETNGKNETPVSECHLPKVPDADDTTRRAWYYRQGDTLVAVSEILVTGFDEYRALYKELYLETVDKAKNTDGTVSVILYADMEVTGTVNLIKDRVFKDFDTDTAISIPSNGAFTAKLTATGANIFGSDYRLDFTNALPENVKLTMVVMKEGKATEYYYYITTEETSSMTLRDFKAMGKSDGSVAELPSDKNISGGSVNTDTMLITFDFIDAGITSAQSNKVSLKFVNGKYVQENAIAEFGYELTAPNNGSVSATDDDKHSGTVTVTTPTNSVYSGKSYQLIAKFDRELPYDATVELDSVSGTRIDANTFAFDNLPTAETNYAISNVYGEYTVQWNLVLKETDNNSMGIVLASSGILSFNNVKSVPSLALTVKSIDGSEVNVSGHTLEVGKVHTVVFEIDAYAGAAVHAKAQLQNENLANFVDLNNIVCEIKDGNLTVTFPADLEKGVYRVAVSLNGSEWKDNDNVYYSFVIN